MLLEVRRPQRKRFLPSTLQDSVVMHALPIWSATERNNSTLLIHEYYEMLDLVRGQIASRFDNPALAALASLQNGKMTPSLAEFCTLHDRDPETIERQLNFTALALREQSPDFNLSLQQLFTVSTVQPELHYIVDVDLTLPVTSSNAERAFSKLRLIKNHLRTTMTSERLQSLVRVSSNKSHAMAVPLKKMLDEFTKSEHKICF